MNFPFIFLESLEKEYEHSQVQGKSWNKPTYSELIGIQMNNYWLCQIDLFWLFSHIRSVTPSKFKHCVYINLSLAICQSYTFAHVAIRVAWASKAAPNRTVDQYIHSLGYYHW